MISQNITKLIGQAMKAHDKVRLSTLRMLSSEFNYEKIRIQKELEESDEERVIRKEVKKRKEAIEMYVKAGAEDKATNEKAELAILSEFLPPEITEEQIIQLVNESIKSIKPNGIQDMGKVIADIKSKAPGVDGSFVANIVRSRLIKN